MGSYRKYTENIVRLSSLLAVVAVALSLTSVMHGCGNEKSNPIASELDSLIQVAFDLDMTPGMAVAVVKDGEIVYSGEFGSADLESQRPVTPETMFYIASTTKSFTAFAATLLAERGEINLDAPISEYLPDLELVPPLSPDSITLRDLLNHTHGISNEGPVLLRTAFTGVHTHDQLVSLMKEHPPAQSGRAFHYGNIGYNVAGLVLEEKLGIGWKELLRREIFDPLGMNHTSAYMSKVDRMTLAYPHEATLDGFEAVYFGKTDSNMHAAGGHVSSALDLAKWLQVHLDSGRYDGRQVFPAKVVEETHRKQVEQDRTFGFFHRYGWALGWDLGTYNNDTLIHRFGGFTGFRSHVSFMPSHGIGVVVLVNCSDLGSPLADMVACTVYDRLLGKADAALAFDQKLQRLNAMIEERHKMIAENLETRAARPQELPVPLDAFVGAYSNESLGEMVWRLEDGKLHVTFGVMQSPVEVFDNTKNQLRVELMGNGQILTFEESGGMVTGMSYLGREFERVE